MKEKKVFNTIYYLSTIAVIIGFVYSRALLSIGQISIAAVWLLEGNLDIKWNRFKGNSVAVLWSGLYLVHVFWLINTSDFEYAAEDLRIKLPLFLFPIVFSSTDIFDKNRLKYYLYFFIATIFSATVVITVNYFMKRDEIKDIREASFLISHIRLALMICLSISIGIYYSMKESGYVRYILILICLWMTVYMIFFAYLTGIIILGFLLLFMLVYYMRRKKLGKKVQISIYGIIVIILSIVAVNLFNATADYIEFGGHKDVPDLSKTQSNREYVQWYKPDLYNIRENGYLVFQNLNFEETQQEWNRRSDVKINYFDKIHPETEDILLRFLASKGLSKDSSAVASLKEVEVQAIENGVTNFMFINRSRLYKRLYNMFWEFDVYTNGGNFNGHSLGIRLEFWKTGIHVFKRHFLTGTGTGDIENAFQDQYILDNSSLSPEWRFRSHNQFISIAATFGIFGLLYFLIVIIYPLIKRKNGFLYLSFTLIFVLSILTEDTLETQIGVTFYAFFGSLLYFQKPEANTFQEPR